MYLNKIIQGNCNQLLDELETESIDCCVTSPPYYAQRDYGVDEQLGLEETPEIYIDKMIQVFRKVKRVLKQEGTLWINIGDTYASAKKDRTEDQVIGSTSKITGKKNQLASSKQQNTIVSGLKPKDLIGIPWMLAFALRADGWYLRQDIIWNKPNPMPESVKDRCTKSHEYIFLLSKSRNYYFDNESIKVPVKDTTIRRLIQDIENQNGSERIPNKTNGNMKAVAPRKGSNESNKIGLNGSNFKNHHNYLNAKGELLHGSMVNKKSVWTITTKPFKQSHFATFPQDLIVDCIKAGCPENGIVLDPFMGSGTTGIVAKKLNRNFIGFELNQEYINIANKRLYKELGCFL